LDEFITDFGKSIESIAERIKQLKISIKGKIKD
jgi:DNA-binding ferritin-like protein